MEIWLDDCHHFKPKISLDKERSVLLHERISGHEFLHLDIITAKNENAAAEIFAAVEMSLWWILHAKIQQSTMLTYKLAFFSFFFWLYLRLYCFILQDATFSVLFEYFKCTFGYIIFQIFLPVVLA